MTNPHEVVPIAIHKGGCQENCCLFVPGENQTMDVLTKALTFVQFHYLCSKLDINPRQFSLRGDVSEYSHTQADHIKISEAAST